MGPRYIRLPTSEEEVIDKVENFHSRYGIPQCIGAIDGTHTDIKAPSLSPTDYINRKSDILLMYKLVATTNIAF